MMPDGNYSLELLEWSQASSLLAFAVRAQGPEDGFPALLGVSVRSERTGVVDLLPHEVDCPRTLVCLVEHPERLGAADDPSERYWNGEITFALWSDERYQSELARIPWQVWKYADIGSIHPYSHVDPCTRAYLEHEFEEMRERFGNDLRWIAHRVHAEAKAPLRNETKHLVFMGEVLTEEDRSSLEVLGAIDFQRRELPASAVKRTLRESRLSEPVGQIDGTWLVYKMDDGKRIYYSTETTHYRLVSPYEEPSVWPDIQRLAAHLTTHRP